MENVMSRSFAVWGCRDYRNGQSYESSHTLFVNELHVNFWNINSQDLNYLDFGVIFKRPEIEDVAENGAICLFFPFKKEKKDFQDLSENLDRNKDLVTAVFNEYLIKSENLGSKFLKLDLTSKGNIIVNTKFDFVNGTLDHRVSITQRSDGTLIVFKLKECLSEEKSINHYIRFRLSLTSKEIKEIITTFHPNDSFLKSDFERSDIIDFRINEQRNLPSEISSTLASAACTPLKYHFFIIRDMIDECSATGKDFQGSRILESATWKKYFKDNVSFGKHDPMIYHWKFKHDEDTRLSDFSVVVKFKNSRTKLTKVFAYLLYIISFSLIINLAPITGIYNNYIFYGLIGLVLIYIAYNYFFFKK